MKDDAPLDAVQETVVQSALDAPNTGVGTTSNTVFVTGVVLEMSVSGPARVLPGAPITYTLTVTNTGNAAAVNVDALAELPPGSQHVAGGTVQDGIVGFLIPSLAAGSSTQLQYSVRLIEENGTIPPARAQAPAIIGGNPADPGLSLIPI